MELFSFVGQVLDGLDEERFGLAYQWALSVHLVSQLLLELLRKLDEILIPNVQKAY